jgi:leucyl-tRNA synthetase
MKRYNPQEIEPKWQAVWDQTKLYHAADNDPRTKYYYLVEFPYPSGEGLHVGHVLSYTALDIMARHKRMLGYNVLYPMGFDEFGLPTENYAIKHKIAPQVATETNVQNFIRQMKSLGLSFDWDRMVRTSDPNYYRWTQWIFLQLYKAGLAYQDEIAINWCPFEKTGLANEEVVDGKHERCGTPVEKKLLKQWLLKITAYADRLIEDLKTVDYLDRISAQQINWIGRSEGAEIDFALHGITGQDDGKHKVTVYTTRPDTLFGATFIVVSPEVADSWLKVGWQADKTVRDYIDKSLKESELERQEERVKTGVDTGIKAVHPLSGQEIPVWVADYVLGSYGTGAIMAVPAHDERDNEFARKFKLPIEPVVKAPEPASDKIYTGDGPLVNSGDFDGMEGDKARHAIIEAVVKQGAGRGATKYKLRDWIFSRQHYWGEPIPIIHCPKDGAVAVPDDQLPVELPQVDHYEPTETGESPLAAMSDWVNVTCPQCGGPAKRETDTMPNWAGSSWYYLRYADPHNDQAFADRSKLDYWTPVDLYNGGMEHTTLHLLYSRFWHKFLFDQGLVPTAEPYARRRSHGMILGPDGQKMSKSRGNVINPDQVVEQYGADTIRLYEMFMGPFDQEKAWSEEHLAGVSRFIYRVWTLAQDLTAAGFGVSNAQPDGDQGAFELEVDRIGHKTLKKVGADIEVMHFNTAVSALMEYINFLVTPANRDRLLVPESASLRGRTLRLLVLMLAPFTPYLAEELWHDLCQEDSVHTEAWPKYDPELIKDELVEIAVQVNGKLRATVVVAVDASDDEVADAAAAEPKVAKYLEGAEVVKTVVVPRRLVNFVVKAV